MYMSRAENEAIANQSFIFCYDRNTEITTFVLIGSESEMFEYKTIRVFNNNYRSVEFRTYRTIDQVKEAIGSLSKSQSWQVDTTYNTEIGMLAAIFARELDHNVIYNKKDPWDK